MMDRRNFVLSLAGCAAARWLPQAAKPKVLPTFIDVSSKSGVRFRHQSSRTSQKYLPESMGAGVAGMYRKRAVQLFGCHCRREGQLSEIWITMDVSISRSTATTDRPSFFAIKEELGITGCSSILSAP